MKKKRNDWPGPYIKRKYKKDGTHKVQGGEPIVLRLHRGINDRGLHTNEWQGCCGCGLRHLMTYEVFRETGGKYWMNIRAFADERTRPKK